MMATTVCPRFSQNAWRRDMCANCFKTKTEHAAANPPRVVKMPSIYATPKQSILKNGATTNGTRSNSGGRSGVSVCFPASEVEVIGYDGGDVSTDEEDPEDVPDRASSENSSDNPIFPEPSEDEERALQNLTRRNTDFNSENANLLSMAPPPTIKRAAEPPKVELGRKMNGSAGPVISVTPFGSNNKSSSITEINGTNGHQERTHRVTSERRPPLGHEASTPAPLTAPALVTALVKEVSSTIASATPPAESSTPVLEVKAPEPIAVVVKTPEIATTIEEVPQSPAFLRHKDSVDLISPPMSPLLVAKTEERPAPIGKVSSTLTVTLKNAANVSAPIPTSNSTPNITLADPVNSKQSNEDLARKTRDGPRLVEPRSSALIRRWTVGERVLIQPRKPVLDAPEIVPLTLQSSTGKVNSLGLEPRELAGQPDGEDASTSPEPSLPNDLPLTMESVTIKPTEPPLKPAAPKEPATPIIESKKSTSEIEPRSKAPDKPPTPPSSPLPDEEEGPSVTKPPSLPSSPPPVLPSTPKRPTSLPAPNSNPRSSFLHGAMLGRPQVPTKPSTLTAGVNKRHTTSGGSIPVSTPQLPPLDDTRPDKHNSDHQTPASKLKEEVTTPKTPSALITTPKTPSSPITPIHAVSIPAPKPSTPIYEPVTPEPCNKDEEFHISGLKPPLISCKSKHGSVKKRQAPKPPVLNGAFTPDFKPTPTHTRNLSQESFEDLTRRDSITSIDKSPPSKKNNNRFSLRRLLRLGKDEKGTFPESPSSPTSSPSPPGSPPCRPEIIHPSTLDGREVQVITRVQQKQQAPPGLPSGNTPAGRPRPPPPPPRTLSLSTSTPPNARPTRPPPPDSAQLLQMRENAVEKSPQQDDDHAVYANLDEVKKRVASSPSKPQRTGSLRENTIETSQQLSPTSDDGDYETVHFADGRMTRQRRSTIMGSLEENYGAVVGANHRALAQLLAALRSLPLPPSLEQVSLSSFSEENNLSEENRTLTMLQTLAALRDLQDIGTNMAYVSDFVIIRPQDLQLAEIGPRVKHIPHEEPSTPSEPLKEVGTKACHLLLPSDAKLPVILTSTGFSKALAYLEFKLWGPELAPNDKEVALQRWLDLERATALQNLAQRRNPAQALAISQELYVNFLVQASAVGLARASVL